MARHVRGPQSLLLSTRSRNEKPGEDQTTTVVQRAISVLSIVVCKLAFAYAWNATHECSGRGYFVTDTNRK